MHTIYSDTSSSIFPEHVTLINALKAKNFKLVNYLIDSGFFNIDETFTVADSSNSLDHKSFTPLSFAIQTALELKNEEKFDKAREIDLCIRKLVAKKAATNPGLTLNQILYIQQYIHSAL